jgi:error-prone DNA polymerase
MVEGKLQVEGEVIHVILSRCYNISKLLGPLTATHNQDLPLLTLARADQKPEIQFHVENKKTQDGKTIQQKIFPDARNFR